MSFAQQLFDFFFYKISISSYLSIELFWLLFFAITLLVDFFARLFGFSSFAQKSFRLAEYVLIVILGIVAFQLALLAIRYGIEWIYSFPPPADLLKNA